MKWQYKELRVIAFESSKLIFDDLTMNETNIQDYRIDIPASFLSGFCCWFVTMA